MLRGSQGLNGRRQAYAERLWILLGIVGILLMIVCANVANLLLARSENRQKEIALRISLGAGPVRLLRQLLTESLIVALSGGALGLVLAYWCKDSLLRWLSLGSNPLVIDPKLDLRVLGFTTTLCISTAMIAGIIPAHEFLPR